MFCSRLRETGETLGDPSRLSWEEDDTPLWKFESLTSEIHD